ncbi:hypothetical protein LT335_00605 [Spiroplasma sp. JKS002669]|uniref:DEAD/DEAH box helicase family protein n=1 Tax=Spiroplasma attinicola TaxID=2904537 RepID=UPI0020C0EC07|nr:DEAD/DEAH box helicase family protein [Spiroplasma sp. JKS002669]MCL6429044.1 hypothetical protein [Spiroplasma sp. JKS002669]
MTLTKSQENAVNKLIDFYNNYSSQKIVSFKAPTGSGKTFMASAFISKIFAQNLVTKKKKIMFIIATISDAELPRAFSNKLENYKKYLSFQNFEIEYRISPSLNAQKIESIKPFNLEENKVLIFGTSSFGKKKIFSEEGILDSFIEEIRNSNEWEIIYIRDEAHKGTNKFTKLDEISDKTIDSKLNNIANFTIQMTATPNGSNPIIELKSEEMKNDGVQLLKEEAVKPNITEELINDDSEEFTILKLAVDQFKNEIKVNYKKLENDDIYIRPAMLIQVSSKLQKRESEFNKNMSKIEKIIENSGLTYMKYFSDEKKSGNIKADVTLEEASKNDSLYDVIIFKVGPATGWDIPRACMLVQLRSICSETLNIQTLGRVKRNPYPNLKFNEITNKYYVYSNYQERSRELEGYKLKDKFKNRIFYQGTINKDNRELVFNNYYKYIQEIINDNFFIQLCKKYSFLSMLEYPDYSENYITEKRSYNFSAKLYIKNKIQLRIFINDKILKNNILFSNHVMNIIENFAEKNVIERDIILYTIIKDYISRFKDALTNSYKNNRNKEKFKLTNSVKAQEFYQIWVSNNDDKKIQGLEKYQNYGYELISSIKEAINIQYLDSYAEMCFLEEFLKEIEAKNKYFKEKININFFAKMPTLGSSIYFEYFSVIEQNYLKSYMDFMLVTESEKIYMIEVKSYNDYDENKTNDLLESYKQYMLENGNDKLELCLVYSGKDKFGIKKPIKILKLNSEKTDFQYYIIDKFINLIK